MSNEFNRNMAIFQLHELQDHTKNIIEEIKAGRYDEDTGDLSYPVALAHLMDHLVMAWHYSRKSDEEIDSISQDHFERLTHAIPKFDMCNEYQLVELYDKI